MSRDETGLPNESRSASLQGLSITEQEFGQLLTGFTVQSELDRKLVQGILSKAPDFDQIPDSH